MDEETLDSEDSRIISRFSTENERLQKRVNELEALLTRREEQLATRPTHPPSPSARPSEGGNTEAEANPPGSAPPGTGEAKET